MWTLVIFLAVGGPSITIDGFTALDDCKAMGSLNVEFVNPKATFRCDKAKRPKA